MEETVTGKRNLAVSRFPSATISHGIAALTGPSSERLSWQVDGVGMTNALAEAGLFADGLGIGLLERGGARGFLFASQDGTAFLEGGGELLEEFAVHGIAIRQ